MNELDLPCEIETFGLNMFQRIGLKLNFSLKKDKDKNLSMGVGLETELEPAQKNKTAQNSLENFEQEE